MSEFQTNDETLYRFDRDDRVLQLLEGDVIGTYRWRRSFDFTIDPDVQVDVDGMTYEYVDEDTEVALVRGDVPHGITEGCHLVWYEQTDSYGDLAIVLDQDSAVLGGLVEELDDDEDDFEPVATTISPTTPVALATESAGRPLVPVLLVLIAIVALVVFLLAG